MKRSLCLAVVLAAPMSANAYVDQAATLGQVVNQSTQIVVLRVAKVSKEKRAIIFEKTAELKGQFPGKDIRHALSDGGHPREARTILDWAAPGKTAICFLSGKVCQTCIGKYWYECHAGEAPWWSMNYGKPELALAYFGPADRLRAHVTEILAGKTVVIPAITHASKDYWAHGDVMFKKVLGGKDNPIWRIKASLQMPTAAYQVVKDHNLIVGYGAGAAEDVPELVKALKGKQTAARVDAAVGLGLIGPPAKEAVPALGEALKGPDYLVRIAAAEALVRVGVREADAIGMLVYLLQKDQTDVRRAAAEALGNLGADAKAAAGPLTELLQDKDADVRWAAADALGRIGPDAKSAVPALTALLKHPTLRSIAADALGGIGPDAKAAAKAIAELTKDADGGIRRTAAIALSRIGGSAARPAVPVFIEMLKSPNERTRWDALQYLITLGAEGKAAVPAIAELVKQGDGIAAATLAHVAGPEATAAIPYLVESLGDGDWDTSSYLLLIGPAVAEPLIAKTKDLAGHVARERAVKVLADAAGKDEKKVVPLLMAALQDDQKNRRLVAASVLSGLANKAAAKKAAPGIRKMLPSKDVWERIHACWCLVSIDAAEAKAAVPAALADIDNSDMWVRRSMVQILGTVGAAGNGTAPKLKQKRQDPDEGVRIAAAMALVQLGGLDAKAAVAALVPALKSGDQWVRQTAAECLGELGKPAWEAIPALRQAGNDEVEAVRKAAAEAIRKLEKK